MTRNIDHLATEIGVPAEDLTISIEQCWVLPSRCGTELDFTETDRARLRMIAEFRHDLGLDDEAIPVILDLIDRLYGTRARLRAVLEAVAALPESQRDFLLRRVLGDPES
jgi:chaperone modulatory protein CbpM